ncbi:universal stress protein [Oryzobacter sp. R7]|uniref:universal stress protein n=1 Tax=Oryzobacter faecalis TaxID=3388656 RepID=UPI00398CF01F
MADNVVTTSPETATGTEVQGSEWSAGPRGADGAVVAALHGSPADEPVTDWAADEAVRLGAPLRLLSVVDPGFQLMPYEALVTATPSLAHQIEEGARVLLDRAAARARERHPALDVAVAVVWGSPAASVLDAARGAARVVVGAPHKNQLERVLLGSVALPVVAHAECTAVVVPAGTTVRPVRRLVVGVDGSERSARAVEVALETAAACGAEVTCVVGWHVEVQDGVVVTERGSDRWAAVEKRHLARGRAVVDPAAARHPDVAVDVVVRQGAPSRVLLDACSELGADALVVASRGVGGFRGLLLGSVSRRVIEKANRVVIVAR